jgi:hypothetical protein
MMELTKIMSKRSFPYTIHFVAVTGRTRTVRLRHLAELAKEKTGILWLCLTMTWETVYPVEQT